MRAPPIGVALVLLAVMAGSLAQPSACHAAVADKQVKEADKVATAAKVVYEQGQFPVAADLYRKAFRLNPAKPDYLYGVGRAEQRAGRYAQAKAAFEQLLALIPSDDPLAEKARKALGEVAAADKAAQPTPKPAEPAKAIPPPVVVPAPVAPAAAPTPVHQEPKPASLAQKPAPAITPRLPTVAAPAPRPLPMPAVAAFAVAVAALGGTVGFGLAAVEADAFADRYRTADGEFVDPKKLPQAEATALVRDINFKRQMTVACGATMAAAVAVGGWLWVRDRPVRVASDGQSVLLAWRF